ncbi:hypothetical protein BST61_g2348 [Cercospora zeina]
MNRFRRPWTIHCRKTDGVQLNTLENPTTKPMASDEELGPPSKNETRTDAQPINISTGHPREIEVDLNHVLHDQDGKDIDGDTSPYPEVRAVVPETDDPTIPVNTLRMWIWGTIWVLIGAGVNQFFSLRYPAVHIVSIVAELLAFPMGVALAKILPITSVQLPFFGEWRINPDHHFNVNTACLNQAILG